MLGLDRRTASYTWTIVFILLLLRVAYLIRETLLIFVVALLLAYLLWPLVKFFDRRLPGRSKVAALAIVYLLLVGVLVILGIAIGSRVVVEANNLAAKVPELVAKLQQPAAETLAPSAQSVKAIVISTLRKQVIEHSRDLLSLLPNAALGILSHAGSLIFVVLVPVLSFFFLKDGQEIRILVLGAFSKGSRRDLMNDIAADVHLLLAQYMRALVLLAVVAFAAYALFFTILRVPYGVLLAAIAFPLEFIPMLGPLTGAIVVLLVAGLSGYHHLLVVLVFLAAFRVFQDYVVSPKLLSSGMELHPLVVMFGVLAGAAIGGVAGSVLSVPILATLRIVYRQLQKRSAEPILPGTEVRNL